MDDGRLVPELPAHDEYLERGVLGAILAQPDRALSAALLSDLAFLEPADFWREANKAVYLAVEARYAASGSCLIGDLWRAPGMESAYLTGLVVEAAPALIVKQEALRLAELGLKRLILWGAGRMPKWTPEQVDGFNTRVQAKRDRIAAVRGGERTVATAGNLLAL